MRTAKQRGRLMVRSHSDRLVRSEPFEVFTRPQRSLPARLLGLVIRWRAELLVLGLLLTAWVWLTKQMPTWAAGTTLGGTVLVLMIWPASRRYLVHRGYSVMVRHRLRSTFVERRVMNYSGNLPLLLWARPTPVGERIWVLLRAGIDPQDIEVAASYYAVSGWARDARVVPNQRLAAIVVVETVRRDPLTGPAVVSPLSRSHLVPVPPLEEAGHA
ncbi:hypothetical protein ACL02T_29425 [Pseudonocardia sp. RS010]|uniref:hypothetical protein n=1 Tax=Pseudonocardia sp. RS010 TaxID=3385979 RepID=UPI0039A1E963